MSNGMDSHRETSAGPDPSPDPVDGLEPGRNCWKIVRADRASVLIDAAPYYGALRRALLSAQRRVFIVGWDIDSRTRHTPCTPMCMGATRPAPWVGRVVVAVC